MSLGVRILATDKILIMTPRLWRAKIGKMYLLVRKKLFKFTLQIRSHSAVEIRVLAAAKAGATRS
jgi:hypothetical protein